MSPGSHAVFPGGDPIWATSVHVDVEMPADIGGYQGVPTVCSKRHGSLKTASLSSVPPVVRIPRW